MTDALPPRKAIHTGTLRRAGEFATLGPCERNISPRAMSHRCPQRHFHDPAIPLPERRRLPPPARALSDLNRWRHVPVKRYSVVAVPVIWITLLLSLHFHAAMLIFWLPRIPNLNDANEPGKAGAVLVTRLTPLPKPVTEAPSQPAATAPPPPPSPPPRAAAPSPRRATPPPPAVRTPPPPIVAPGPRPVEPQPAPPAPPAAAPAPPRPPAETDLASYIEARRRARGDPTPPSAQGPTPNAPPTETENERLNRIVAANLAPKEQPTFGYDPKNGGGVFQIKRIGYDDAEFYFTGWNKDIGRRAKQLIEIRTGNNGDIRHAIVRKMISIIREEVKDDFTWVSDSHSAPVRLSARPADNAALEEFMMQEFFSGPRGKR